MKFSRPAGIFTAAFVAILFTLITGTGARAAVRERAYAFNRADGTGYRAGLRFDSAGNLWGTSLFGGAYGYGDVFEVTRDANGRVTETVLYSFTNGNDGGNPTDDQGPTIDSAGNLYGTTGGGGAYGGGTVFKLTPSASGWQESVLYSFTCGNDGCGPEGGVVFDAAGNLYGTTFGGGPGGIGYGTAYELSPDLSGNWTETTLHVFTGGQDGAGPYAALIFDSSGNLYGTTFAGGNFCNYGTYFGCGLVFRLTHTSSGWHEQVLYSFTGGSDGASPYNELTFDPSGNLYGTAARGGDPSCACGAVFRLTPVADFGAQWNATVLHAFTGGSDGATPFESVVLDAKGNVYGTATAGGQGSCLAGHATGCGTVFRLAPDRNGGWRFDLLYSFLGKSDGGLPFGVVLGEPLKLYGTAGLGGNFSATCRPIGGCGTVFELTQSSGTN
jgi:uncharacterized repeat protein (TIGR03803 family)